MDGTGWNWEHSKGKGGGEFFLCQAELSCCLASLLLQLEEIGMRKGRDGSQCFPAIPKKKAADPFGAAAFLIC